MNKKEAYEKKIQAQMDEWNAEIEKLKAQAAKARAEVQIKYNEQLEDLMQKKETVGDKLTQLQDASEETWENLKADMEEGVDRVKSAVNAIINRFK